MSPTRTGLNPVTQAGIANNVPALEMQSTNARAELAPSVPIATTSATMTLRIDAERLRRRSADERTAHFMTCPLWRE
jgi:hypothetical protein